MEPIAHTKNSQGNQQGLIDHLMQVAELASVFAKPLGALELARIAGLLHDIGKFNPAFQNYLLQAEKGNKGRGPDHKGAGAVYAWKNLWPLAAVIQGHHGGMYNIRSSRESKNDLKSWISERSQDPAVQSAIEEARRSIPGIDQAISLPALKSATETELFVRLLFSCLVDADFLDTEQHFSPGKSIQRSSSVLVSDLWSQFEEYYRKKTEGAMPSTVNNVRRQIYQHCYDAAELKPGFFRLTAPTGGGKTLSSLAFALRHAKLHGKQRIIYAIPFTSIIDQVAREFRAIFPGNGTVLEHHSSTNPPDDPNNVPPSEVWRRLSAENWDASVVITTTVQLFESLFSNGTSACRKLHNVAQSVIILDEVQLLPVHLLEPILDVLQQLVARYGTTIVLCTATQPALDRKRFPELRENLENIIPKQDILQIFSALSRVTYEWPCLEEQWTWEQVATRAKQEKQALTIVNTKKDAVNVAKAFDDPNVLHLSTSMCGTHRRAVLAEAQRRLDAKEPCYLISTQLIEAGVDIDFPLVLRALCPLDSVVQSAGRCNRNGELFPAKGVVIVFDPAEGTELKSYRTGISTLNGMMKEGLLNLEDHETFQAYFHSFYSLMPTDKSDIQTSRKNLKYETVSRDFKMIEEDTVPVVVFYDKPKVEKILNDLEQNKYQSREIIRQLQPYMVSVRKYAFDQAIKNKVIEEIAGIFVLSNSNNYHSTYGLTALTIGKSCYIV